MKEMTSDHSAGKWWNKDGNVSLSSPRSVLSTLLHAFQGREEKSIRWPEATEKQYRLFSYCFTVLQGRLQMWFHYPCGEWTIIISPILKWEDKGLRGKEGEGAVQCKRVDCKILKQWIIKRLMCGQRTSGRGDVKRRPRTEEPANPMATEVIGRMAGQRLVRVTIVQGLQCSLHKKQWEGSVVKRDGVIWLESRREGILG